jgi:hypothetical protein
MEFACRFSHLRNARPIAVVAIAAALGGAASCANASAALTSTTCTRSPYAYAGLIANSDAAGIKATIIATRPATVRDGHVAGWIGVGGPSAGPNGKAEWLQAGLNVVAGKRAELYSELTQPGRDPAYTTLGYVAVGKPYHLAVVELASAPGTWQILLNGKPASEPVLFPGSHGAFQPMAMTESWNDNVPSCNDYAYRFESVVIAGHSSWERLSSGSAHTLSDVGYRLAPTDDGFVAGRNF